MADYSQLASGLLGGLGSYLSGSTAQDAYNTAAELYHGEFHTSVR